MRYIHIFWKYYVHDFLCLYMPTGERYLYIWLRQGVWLVASAGRYLYWLRLGVWLVTSVGGLVGGIDRKILTYLLQPGGVVPTSVIPLLSTLYIIYVL